MLVYQRVSPIRDRFSMVKRGFWCTRPFFKITQYLSRTTATFLLLQWLWDFPTSFYPVRDHVSRWLRMFQMVTTRNRLGSSQQLYDSILILFQRTFLCACGCKGVFTRDTIETKETRALDRLPSNANLQPLRFGYMSCWLSNRWGM